MWGLFTLECDLFPFVWNKSNCDLVSQIFFKLLCNNFFKLLCNYLNVLSEVLTLDVINVREVSQTEKEIYHIVSLICGI